MAQDQEDTYQEFKSLVNMTPSDLEKWLATEESKKVGFKSEEKGESVGHESGRHILKIKAKKKADLTDEDYHHMAKVVGYVKRHMAQKPKDHTREELSEMNWTHSLKNWGHDPMKRTSGDDSA
ncbi:DUF3140 domain-containing protein [bacterium]|nr:MAG: DUF3140 domain-containing protein [bacterium]